MNNIFLINLLIYNKLYVCIKIFFNKIQTAFNLLFNCFIFAQMTLLVVIVNIELCSIYLYVQCLSE